MIYGFVRYGQNVFLRCNLSLRAIGIELGVCYIDDDINSSQLTLNIESYDWKLKKFCNVFDDGYHDLGLFETFMFFNIDENSLTTYNYRIKYIEYELK